jgi:hypothetical protein
VELELLQVEVLAQLAQEDLVVAEEVHNLNLLVLMAALVK